MTKKRKMRLFLIGFGPLASDLLKKIASNSNYEVLGINPVNPRKSTSRVPVNLDLDVLPRLAKKLNIPIYYSDKVNEPKFVQTIKELDCDLLLNWGHHQLFKKPLLDSSRIGCMNNHPGLIPYGRGSGAVYGEGLNERKFVGQTIHLMSTDFDMGKIVHQRIFEVKGDEYQNEMDEKFKDNIVNFYIEGIEKLRINSPVKDVEGFGTYYPRKPEGDEIIYWNNNSSQLLKIIRGRSPYIPSITFLAKDWKEVFVWKVSLSEIDNYNSIVGQVLYRDSKRGVLVKTGDSAIWLEEISDEANSKRFIPNFPIGTCFVSNWIFEISRIRKEIEYLKNKSN